MYDPNAKPKPSRRQQIKQAHANRMNNQAVKKHGQEKVQSFYNAAQSPAPAMSNAQQVNQQAVNQHGQQAVQQYYDASQNQQAVNQHGQQAVQQYYDALQNQQAVNQHGQQAVQDFYGALQGGSSPFGALAQQASSGARAMYDPNKGASKKTEQPAVQPQMPAHLSNLLVALAGGGTPFSGGVSNPAPFGNQMMGSAMMGSPMMGNQMMFGGYSPMGMGGFGGYNPMAQVPMGMGAMFGGFNRAGWGY